MSEYDPFDKDLGFDEAEECWPIERPKRKFSLRNHWVVWLIGVNCLSLFVMFFLYSDGHPIDFVIQLSQKIYSDHRKPKEEELLLQDAQRIRTAVSFAKGVDVRYSIQRYTGDAMWEVYYRNDKIMNAVGNSFVQVRSGYYYLSADRQRLYHCLIEEPPKYVHPPARLRAEPQGGEIYQAPDGTWRNY